MRFFGLIVLLLIRLLLGLPKALFRSLTGWGYRKRFEIGGKTVVRPESFKTRDHKRAFEDVGKYLTDALTRDVLLSYQEKSLKDTKGLYGRHKTPLAVWWEVLAFYQQQGCVERRWELGIPSYSDYLKVPDWDAAGERFPPAAHHAIGGLVPDSAQFIPSLLTDTQKAELIGKPYALHPNDRLKWEKGGQAYVTLEEKHFMLTYFRRRASLSKENLEKGAKTLSLLADAGAFR